MAGDLIMFASDLVDGAPAEDAEAPLEYAVQLLPADPAGFDLSSLPVFDSVPSSWLSGMRIMGGIMVATADLLAGSETIVRQGLNFAGYVRETADNTAAPFLTSLGQQAVTGSNATATYIRGCFPLSAWDRAAGSTTSVDLSEGEVEIRLIDTTLDAGWAGFPDASLTMGQAKLLVQGLGQYGVSEDTSVSLDCDFVASIPVCVAGSCSTSVLGGNANGVYAMSGAFQMSGELTQIRLPTIQEYVAWDRIAFQVQFDSQETGVLFHHLSVTSAFTVKMFANSQLEASGIVTADRYGWVTTASIPEVSSIGDAMCSMQDDLCGNEFLESIGLSDVDIRLSLATADVDIVGVGLTQPRVESGVGVRCMAQLTNLPDDVREVLDLLGFSNVQAVLSGQVPFPPTPLCETVVSFAIEETMAANAVAGSEEQAQPSGFEMRMKYTQR